MFIEDSVGFDRRFFLGNCNPLFSAISKEIRLGKILNNDEWVRENWVHIDSLNSMWNRSLCPLEASE